ncbi:MAG: TonB-dependent receptor plug domain-containing protein, partial [Calditrichota bacterium]
MIESPVPIDVITEAEIKQSGFSETTQVLQLLIPSYNAPQPSITDGSDHMRPATLRGLGPDQVLILVNGKRRHTSALVHVNGSIGRGSTGVDMNSIPAASIERIEVLRDGASAQYGSDAISGVINVVLKEQLGFDASLTYSQYLSTTTRGFAEDEGNRPTDDASTFSWDGDGAVGAPEDVDYDDGQTTNLHLGYGSKIMGDGHLYVSTQVRTRDFANRAGLDPRQQYIDGDNDPREAGFDRLNHRFGNGEFSDVSIFFNGYVPMNDEGTQLYGFGGFNKRHGESGCFYRRSLDNRTVRAIHPDGFLPIMNNDLEDLSVAAGIKGAYGDWAYDASTVFGKNSFNFGVENTNNASLGLNSATEFDAGTLKFQQATSNLDILGNVDIGTAKPVNVAFGAEVRWENYKIDPGEETSFLNGG